MLLPQLRGFGAQHLGRSARHHDPEQTLSSSPGFVGSLARVLVARYVGELPHTVASRAELVSSGITRLALGPQP